MWKNDPLLQAARQMTTVLVTLVAIAGCKPKVKTYQPDSKPFKLEAFESLDYRYTLRLIDPSTADWIDSGNRTAASYAIQDGKMVLSIKGQANALVLEKNNDRWMTNAGLELIESSMAESMRRKKWDKERETQIQDAESRRRETMKVLHERSQQR